MAASNSPGSRWADGCVAAGIALLGGALLGLLALPTALLLRGIPRKPGRRLLCLVPAGFEAILTKGVGSLISEREEAGFWDGVETLYFPSEQNRRTRWSPVQTIRTLRPIARFLKGAGWTACHHTLNGLRLAVWGLSRSLSIRREVTVIRGQDPFPMGLLAAWLAGLTGVRWGVSLHGDPDLSRRLDDRETARWGRSRRLAETAQRWVLRRAEAVWVVRPSLTEWVTRRGADRDRIAVLPHGVDLSFWKTPETDAVRFRKEAGLSGKPLLLFIGRLEKVNYPEDFLRIAAEVKRSHPDLQAVVIGDGSQRRALEAAAGRLGLSDSVRWLGFLPRESLRLWRAASDVQICLMGGFSLLEAAAAGKPVVAYDLAWHRELIRDGATGRLIPEGAIAAAAQAVCRLLEQPEGAQAMGEAAQAAVRDHYDWPIASERRQAAYQRLIGV
ncbi:MAG: hypothetical protein COV76_01575 [Candidatus Omnitrophica bacterium CG11_big_fil_rev_8_21_14_0_20_64_10]|nr:MAG: hypothetical protein COV76_01575 [Candidatus Omnitrophica bacterium CG11_big_fil_rev_8_21_14_0_20_64_10]